MKIFVLLCAIFAVSQAAQNASSSTTQNLVRALLKDYLKEVDPGVTNLTFSISYQCADLRKFRSLELTSKVLESYVWEDSRLQWDPTKYDGIKQIRLPAKSVWTPDFRLYNGQEGSEVRDDVNVLIMFNGTVLWIPTVTYKTYCEPGREKSEDGKGDSIVCFLQIGSWTYDADTLLLRTKEAGLDTYMYLDTCPYVITDPKVTIDSKAYPYSPEKYSTAYFRFRIHHRL